MELDYKRLVQELLEQKVTQKAAGTTPTFQPAHGNGGLFSQPGLEPDLYGAFVLPNYGLYAALPKYPTVFEYLVAGIVTGVTDSTGSEPTGLCDDPPYAGLMKLCQQAYPLGRFSRMTRVGEVDAFGKMHNRGEQNDFTLYGGGFDSLPGAPTVGGANLQSESDKMLMEFSVAWSRDFAPQVFTGTPTANTWQGGTKYFYGLDYLINTGYRDTFSQVACAAADSLIASFGDAQVQTDSGASIVNHVSQMIYELWLNRAGQFGLNPVTGALVMRPQLFHILTSYWACSYLTYRCSLSDSTTGVVDSGDAIALRDAMRNGSYLMVDGQKIVVIQDDTVAETNVGAGVYESSIYFVPLTVLGGRPVTYIEYFNYDTPLGLRKATEDLAPTDSYRTSNGGMFAWHKKPPSNWCVQAVAKTEQRVLLRTPQIAGRLTDVRYVPYVHERDWDPDGTYFVNGGGISQAKTTYVSPAA